MKHEVTFDIPNRDLGRADIKFRVKLTARSQANSQCQRSLLFNNIQDD